MIVLVIIVCFALFPLALVNAMMILGWICRALFALIGLIAFGCLVTMMAVDIYKLL